jgi:5'-nucleotidase, C-terminal domain
MISAPTGSRPNVIGSAKATTATGLMPSTDFGNFVTDAVKVATAADIALINSGSFRVDDFVGFEITHRVLRETFLFDAIGAIALITMSADEVRKCFQHSEESIGKGAFLQTSESAETVRAWSEPVKVALTRFLIQSPEDGYMRILAESHNCTIEDLPGKLSYISSDADNGTLIQLVCAGASCVRYCNEERISGNAPTDLLADTAVDFADSTDKYIETCAALGYNAEQARSFLKIMLLRDRPEQDILDARWRVRLFVLTRALWEGKEWVREDLYKYLRTGSRLRYQRNVPYHDYLDNAMTLLELPMLMQILRDEEPLERPQ